MSTVQLMLIISQLGEGGTCKIFEILVNITDLQKEESPSSTNTAVCE